ncbi:DNA primase [Peptoniphilus catoniae]|uniref:DNA primase n=1 Tax=Peptoniphilus catoniae TaxID=1660341 RepID=UPI0010FF4510|nr:DNA primase [Peptoniphilus catoniae]
MSYIIDDNLLDEIRDRADIVDLISGYVNLKKSGSNYLGLCPFHNEKTPSFSVSKSKGIFKCFGCGAGGDQITFIMKRENLGFREAVKFLADKYGIELRENKNTYDREIIDKKKRAYEANKEAALHYLKNLSSTKSAYDYLKNRQIDSATINAYGIGYAKDSWDDLLNYMKKKGYKEEELEEFNLVVKSKRGSYIDRFRNRIMFPIIDTNKRVIGFGGRNLDKSLPKYINTKDTIIFNKGKHLYNLNIIAKESDREKIILVEGYMDVISLYKSGINYSAASLGTSLTIDQADLIKRYGKQVYICYDSDKAGIAATVRAIDILISENIYPKIVTLTDGLDPDDYIKKYGKLSFELELKNALTYLDYKILKIKENYNLESSEGLSGFTSDVAEILSRVKNPIERDIYSDKVSKEYGVSRNAIISYINILNRNDINKKKRIDSIKRSPKPKIFKPVDKRKKVENYLIGFALESEYNFNYISKNLESYEFLNTNSRIIFEELAHYYLINNTKPDKFLKNLIQMDLVDENYINDIKNIDLKASDFDLVKEELINTIKIDNLENRRMRILKEIESLENLKSADKSDKLNYLIEELEEINKQIQSL